MILTCPRCATRYLAEPIQVWSTGRTVQCAACGQRWRAVGEGVRPIPEPEPAASAEPSSTDETTPVADTLVESAVLVEEAPPAPLEERVEPAPAPDLAPAADETLNVNLSRPKPAGLTASFGSGPSRARRWLAIAFLVVIAVIALLTFRDVIVRALPGLAPIYAAMGLLVHPVAAPHG